MAFTDKQRRSLSTKLKYRYVKTRSSQGTTISYVEGWHVITEANRIFGYDRWDRRTLLPQRVWSENKVAHIAAFYNTKVHVTVRAGGEISRAKASEPALGGRAWPSRRTKWRSRVLRPTRQSARVQPTAIPSGWRSTTRGKWE